MPTIARSRYVASAGPLVALALGIAYFAYSAVRVAHRSRVAWVGVAASLLIVALQVAEVRRSGRPATPLKEPPAWARSDSLVYGLLTAFAIAIGTLAFGRPFLEGRFPVAAAKFAAAVALALGLGWGAMRGVTRMPFRVARLVGLATAAAVIVLLLASIP